jgi:hypothetical protein
MAGYRSYGDAEQVFTLRTHQAALGPASSSLSKNPPSPEKSFLNIALAEATKRKIVPPLDLRHLFIKDQLLIQVFQLRSDHGGNISADK